MLNLYFHLTDLMKNIQPALMDTKYFLLLVALWGISSAATSPPPNIVLIVADDLVGIDFVRQLYVYSLRILHEL